MTEPDRPPSGGIHRKSSRTSRLSVLLVSVIAVVAAAITVAVLLNMRGEPAHRSVAPATASSRPAFASPSPSDNLASPTLSASSPPTPPPNSKSASPTPQLAVPDQGGNPAPSAPLDVLNDSRIRGLAHRAAGQFRAAGWDVAAIGNFTGRQDVPETTIFFPQGREAAARRLAARFGVDRVLPAPPFLSTSHLSVVLARDWDEAR